jgi:hypothetical protein
LKGDVRVADATKMGRRRSGLDRREMSLQELS